MAIQLEKRQSVTLTRSNNQTLTRLEMGLGWDAARSFFGLFGGSIDLDASCVVFDQNQQLLDVVWFRKLISTDTAIHHSGDNRTGDGDGDDETIRVNLRKLRSDAAHLVFVVNNFTGQTFDKVRNAYCCIRNDDREEIARYTLSGKAQGAHSGLILMHVYRRNQQWVCTAIGQPVDGRVWQDIETEIRAVLHDCT